ncbi:cyclin-SDS-like isoform X2 [Brassica napus]|uniref:cyclin-SDS-like isoform X2 n=1 Tax=Brassica napus TaxID=3708 RepID=UPI0006AABDA2|nr:cyclin-SDS-like isoform X2 [Brassica napus]
MKVIASRNSKRKSEASPFAGKKLRSTTRSLQKRAQISPSPLHHKETVAPAASVDSCSNLFSTVDDTVSCGSSVIEKKSSTLKKTRIEEVEVSDRVIDDPKFRRITRSYSKLNREKDAEEIEVSESSFTRSDVTFAEHVSDSRSLNIVSENKESDVVSFISGVDSCSKFGSVTGGGADNNEETEISKPSGSAELKPELETVGCVSDLACTETFSGEDVSEYDEDESSEARSETLSQYSSDFGFSDYTPSMFFDSGSEFSEKSNSYSPVSHTRSLYLQLMAQFCRSTVPNDLESSRQEQHRGIQSELLRFEDEEVEESYQRLRERERSHAYLRDCAKAYRSAMDHTDLIPRLRLIMVQWIVQQCSEMGLQPETLFLGVSLLDRFLSKGSFNNERTLVLVGIASLTLATRIEENQPYNSIRKRNFYIQNLKYSRHEVVAMEWLVQEVLNFKCFSPTIFNFLWFYLKAARANPEVERKAKSLAVTSLSDHTQLCFWPSTVAAGLVVLACIEHNKISAYQRVIKVHVRTEDNELPECVKSLEWLLEH